MTSRRSLAPVAGLVVVAALLVGCSDDHGSDGGDPSTAVAQALQDASGGAEPDEALPQVVAAVTAGSAPLTDDESAAVLAMLGEHPDALRAAAGPSAPGMTAPSVELDDAALDALVAAGGDDESADAFRATYLDYVGTGVEQTINDGAGGEWSDTLEAIDEIWVEPSAEVIGAVEAGCDESGGTCSDRLERAEVETRDAIEAATYAAIPARLLPAVFIDGSERVPMADWSTRQSDEWQRLRDTTLLPLTSGAVERVAHARSQGAGA